MKITCKFFVNIKYQLLIRVWTCFYFLKTCVQTQRSPQTRLSRGELHRRRWWPHWRRSTFTSGSGIWIIMWIYSICSALWRPPSKTGPDRFVLTGFIESPPFRFWYISINIWTTDWVTPDILIYIYEFMKLSWYNFCSVGVLFEIFLINLKPIQI